MLERENGLLAPDSIYSILYPVVLADSQTRLTQNKKEKERMVHVAVEDPTLKSKNRE